MSAVTHPGPAAPPRWALLSPLPHVLEVRAEGVVPREVSDQIYDAIRDHLRAHPEVDTLVWNLLDLVSYAPGVSAAGIRLVVGFVPRIRRSVVITRSRTVAGLVNVSRVLAPTVERQVFSSLGEALTWVAQALPASRSRRHRAA